MRIALIMCEKDIASINIGENIIEITKPKKISEFQGRPVYEIFENVMLIPIDREHIFYDNLDRDIRNSLGLDFDIFVFLSRHSSKSAIRTLTVHPIGNFGENKYGGLPRELVPAEPYLMSETLRVLCDEAKDLEYMCSYEVTHHGPYLVSKAFFVEIGSSENAWKDKEAGFVVASSLIQSIENFLDGNYSKKDPVVGVGGGHYAPRFTRYALKGYNFGHMVPEHAISLENVLLAMKRTPNAKGVAIHWKGSNHLYMDISKEIEKMGVKVEKLK